jgi:hypothetical protein
MKKIFTALAIMATASVGYAQYYTQSYTSIGTNPGGLNTDVEQTAGVLGPQGWATVQATSPTPVWSPSQTIPFAFSFNGVAETNYKVSTTGILTFDVASTIAAPSQTNATLPSSLIPDKSVTVWGMEGNGGNDAILSKTFGTAPYRQHWVMFSSFSAVGGTGWVYWSIVLEETTNRIFVVDMRNYNTPLTLTVGVQVDGTTATSVAGSPNLAGVNLNGGSADTPDDNTYYEFGFGTQPTADAELANVSLPAVLANGSSTTISGEIINAGSASLTAFDVKYTVNGGAVASETFTGQSIASGAKGSFTLTNPYVGTPGNKDFKFWVEATGDARAFNDTVNTTATVNAGGSGTKKVLVEEFTTAVCQFCPDGEVVVDQIRNTIPEAITVGIHAGFGTDAMTIPAHSAYAAAFTTGAPTAAIDRKIFPGETRVGHSRGAWVANTSSQSTALTPLDITLSGALTSTNTVDLNVDVNFVDFLPNWQNANLTVFVVEDSVVGSGSGYDQINAYNTQAGHPYFGAGNPIVGYPHRHVVRAIGSGTSAWGDETFFTSAPAVNSNYNKTYTINLNSSWDQSKMEFIAFVNYYDASTGENEREIVNVNKIKFSDLVVGVAKNNINVTEFTVYPNPVQNGQVNVKFELKKSENVTVEIVNVLGEVVSSINRGALVAGEQKMNLNVDNLNSGIYFVRVTAGNEVSTQRVSVIN